MDRTAKQQAELEQLLADLVAIHSPSGEEQAAAAFCAEWLERAGLEVCLVEERSIVARLAGRDGPRLWLNTHIDTVPAGANWDVDPLRARWEQDRLVGLGANDAKGCVAAMMFAAAQLADGAELPGELVLSIHHEEETTNAGMTAVLPEVGVVDAAVTGEPTGLEVIRAQAGLGVIVASWHGRSCHAAHVSRVEHKNALLSAARELASLPAPHVLEGEHDLLGPSVLSPTVMRAGQRHNAIPDLCEVTFDARLAAPHDVDECLEILSEHLPSAELHVRSRRLSAVETAADHPLVLRALAHAKRPAAIGSNTLSDMALMPGVPAIKCGPGETVRSHTAGEFITREELAAGANFYAALVPDVLGRLGSGASREGAPGQGSGKETIQP
jgi:acetylornithine deacetylase